MGAGVRVFIACSLDGFIAGPDGDLSWLPEPDPDGEDYGYGSFLAETAAILMGRATYEVAASFERWPYGHTPVFVATTRQLDPVATTVRPIMGSRAGELLSQVRSDTDGPVYVDGGALIRLFIGEKLVDELTVTVIPVILGRGIPLFAGTSERHELTLLSATPYPSGLVQLRYALAAARDS